MQVTEACKGPGVLSVFYSQSNRKPQQGFTQRLPRSEQHREDAMLDGCVGWEAGVHVVAWATTF